MLVDANLLLYAVNEDSPFHEPARVWLTERLSGARRVGLPWLVLGGFLRIATNPRAVARPLDPEQAWQRVRDWLAAPVTWIPEPGAGYPELLGALIARHQVTGNLLPDAQLAALALEHGLTICSADTDFARFDEVTWLNPVAPGALS